jgi:uncharacterized membrane protein
MVEKFARDFVDGLIPVVELIGAVVIGVGVVVAFAAYVLSELRVRPRPYEAIRLLLGRFLALGLEFQLASDILGTAVSPTFNEIGKLGAIATIRTVLNFFLAQEIDRAQRVVAGDRRDDPHGAGGVASPASIDGGAGSVSRDRGV